MRFGPWILMLPAVVALLGGPAELKPAAFQPILRIPLKKIYMTRQLSLPLVTPSDDDDK